jgi:hypothetical protein
LTSAGAAVCPLTRPLLECPYVDKVEARQIASETLKALRRLTPQELERRYLDNPGTEQSTASSGATYQVETQVFWEDQEHQNLRVMVSVDDRGWRSFVPLSDSFIVAPDGTFIGE